MFTKANNKISTDNIITNWEYLAQQQNTDIKFAESSLDLNS